MKRLIFIHKKNKEKLKKIIKKRNKKNKNDSIIFLDKHYQKAKEELYLEELSERFLEKKGTLRSGYNTPLIQKWAFTRHGSHPSFAEELIYENISLWHPLEFFIRADVGYMAEEISISGITFYIDFFSSLFDKSKNKNKPSQVLIENAKDPINKIIIRLCKKRRIPCASLNFAGEKKNFVEKIKSSHTIVKSYINSRILLRKIIARLLCKKRKARANQIIILTSDRLSNMNSETDYFWGPIIKELKKRRLSYKTIEYDRMEVLNSLETFTRRYFPQKYDAQFIGTYYDRRTQIERRKIVGFLKEKYRKLSKSKHFRTSFNYKDIYFYDLMVPKLKKIFFTYSYYIADTFALARSIVNQEKPSVIMVDHEKNYYGRELIREARNKGILSVGFEAEVINEITTYLTQIPIKGIQDKKNKLWRPVPDLKFLWGDYSKEWYEKRNYFPSKNLKVIGAPKFDYLSQLGKKDKEEMRAKYKLRKGQKLVTIITANWRREEEYLDTIFRNFGSNKKYKLVVKMHPTEPMLNKKMIMSKIKQYSSKANIVRIEDTSKLVYASDLVISVVSMLGYEYVLLNKPSIMFGDFTGMFGESEQTYIKEGVIRLFGKTKEFSDEIKKYIDSNKSPEMNAVKRKKYIKKYLFSDDGKASERAVKEILTKRKK